MNEYAGCIHSYARAREFEKTGIVVHATPERAIRVLAYITKYAEDLKK